MGLVHSILTKDLCMQREIANIFLQDAGEAAKATLHRNPLGPTRLTTMTEISQRTSSLVMRQEFMT